MFVVTLLLNEVIGWMRRQSGTSSLRAILYMDEIFGYFPPSANPPSKPPMLTLLKQARAYGLGVVLATQNPVDLDYKGLGNTGTWLIGRLQTERDRDRLLDGLSAAMAGSGPTREQLAALLGTLTQRVFLMRNVHDDAPVLMKSRWALSYLRGPLTPAEISRLMAPRKQQGSASPANGAGASNAAAPGTATDSAGASGATGTRPALPPEVTEAFLPVQGPASGVTYRPSVIASAKLHYVDKPAGVDAWHTVSLAAPFDDAGTEVLWSESIALATAPARDPVPDAAFAEPPAAALRAASYTRWSKALAAHLYEQQRLALLACDALKQVSQPGESEGDFRARLQLAAREKRDAEAEKLRQKYAPRLATLQEQKRRALHKVETERGQASQQKLNTAISVGATILGAFLGRKVVSSSSVGRATTAARSASRIGREAADVARAEESMEVIDKRLADLDSELESAITSLDSTLDAGCIALREIVVTPRKADLAVGNVSLLWTPWRKGTDGFPVEAR
jgi:hypothetical protein